MASCPTSSADLTVDQVADGILASELHRFELLLQETYASAGLLAAKAIEAQAAHKLSVVAGHQVLSAISSAQSEVAAAIACSAEAHRLIDVLGRKLGLDVTSYGVGSKYPGPGADASHLRVAA